MRKKKYSIRSCERCGKEFQPTSSNQSYCLECRREVRKEQIREKSLRYYYAHPDYVVSWQKENPGKHKVQYTKRNFKRRSLGFSPINNSFDGSEGHHINHDVVIYIPKELHRSIQHNQWTGKNMEKINSIACSWFTEDWT